MSRLSRYEPADDMNSTNDPCSPRDPARMLAATPVHYQESSLSRGTEQRRSFKQSLNLRRAAAVTNTPNDRVGRLQPLSKGQSSLNPPQQYDVSPNSKSLGRAFESKTGTSTSPDDVRALGSIAKRMLDGAHSNVYNLARKKKKKFTQVRNQTTANSTRTGMKSAKSLTINDVSENSKDVNADNTDSHLISSSNQDANDMKFNYDSSNTSKLSATKEKK
uniref:Uncharacterized protein n=1 Tax=Biomphalaria glabrata TaxID=6526 RepID=A0A2C9L4M4_BIOGL